MAWRGLAAGRQRGLTLVELLIALVLGLLVIAAIGSVYVGSKRSNTARDALALLQENGRIALRHLQTGISPAGYPLEDEVGPFVHTGSDLDEAYAGLRSVDGDDGDRISISFAPRENGYETDCLGVNAIEKMASASYPDNKATITIDGEERVVNSYFVEAGVLKCRGSGNSAAQPIAEGVDSMQVLYLAEVSAKKLLLTASQLDDEDIPGNWGDVIGVQIALLVNSVKPAGDSRQSTETFALLDASFTIADDLLSRSKAYRVFTTTIPIRNRRVL